MLARASHEPFFSLVSLHPCLDLVSIPMSWTNVLPIRDEMRMIQAMLALAWDGTKVNVAWCLLFIITAHLPSCCADNPHAVIQDVVTSTTTVSVSLLISSLLSYFA